MAEVETKQGQGSGTKRKEDGFADLFEMVLRATSSGWLAKQPYWHLDLNAGCGVNNRAGCDGSPIVFVDAATRLGRTVNAQFCDLDESHTTQLSFALLMRRLPKSVWTGVFTCDNAEFLEKWCDNVPSNAVGTIVCDPNGFTDFPARALAKFCQLHTKMDLIINLNFRWQRLLEGVRRSVQKGSKHPGSIGLVAKYPALAEIMEWFNKPYGLIRNPLPVRGDDFSTIFLTGHPGLASTAFKGFYPMSSKTGLQIMEGKKHVDTHPGLFDQKEQS